MATSNSRDVRLGIALDVSGEQDAKNLARSIGEITAAGGPLAAGFQDSLMVLEAFTAATREAREAENAERTELSAKKKVLADLGDELKKLKASTDAAQKGTTEYAAAERALKLAQIDATTAVRDQKAAVEQAATASKTAAANEVGLRTELNSVVASYRAAGAAAQASGAQQATAAETTRKSLAGIAEQLRTIQSAALVFAGGGILGGLVRDVASTADEFATLSSRVKLATGDGDAFKSSLAGIEAISQRTGTALSANAELFVKLVNAGKTLNLTNADALRLTESITQSLALSGGASEAANAAIIQLTQGLSAGVLRGQDLNSVLEQAPRLAKALADGLGVTTGKLRELGEQGALTSAQVIGALQGQSRALQTEFDQLAPTIGRAITNLSSAWQVYVGEASKASGTSVTVAKAINALAGNLDSLASFLYSAGKAAIAFKAVNLAAELLSVTTATKAAAVATGELAAAQTAANVATTGTAASVSRFAGLLAGLKVFSLVGIVTNFREIGTAIGEGTAKLFGYGKAFADLEAQEKANERASRASAQARAELAQQTQLAADKALGLTVQSQKLVAEFTNTVKGGGEVVDALGKITKALELGNLDGIRNAVTALDVLGQRGVLSGAQIREALASALKNEDLNVFKINALAAFDASEQGARRLKAAIDAIADESLRRAGTSLGELTSGFSEAATRAVNDVDALAKTITDLGLKGEDAGRAIDKSLNVALAAAGTERAVKAVADRFAELGKQGLLSGDQVAAGLEKAKQKADDLKDGVNSLDEALRSFGLKTRGELQQTADKLSTSYQQIANSTTVSLADQRTAFDAYSKAAIAANGGVESSAVKEARAVLEAKEAAIKLGDAIVDNSARGAASLDGLTQHAVDTGAALQKVAADTAALGDIFTKSYNSSPQNLLRKSQSGTLTKDDLAAAQENFANAQANLSQAQRNGTAVSGAGLASLQAEYNQARQILDQITSPTIGGSTRKVGNGTSAGSSLYGPNAGNEPTVQNGTFVTHKVTIVQPDSSSTTVNTNSAADAKALISTLESVARSAGSSVKQ